MANRMRVAFIGAGHYHASLYPSYLRIFANMKDVELVGIHDPIPEVAADRAGRFETKPYTSYKQMIEETRPEFVMALGRHIDMPDAFRFLVNAGVPFLMEKPWAVDRATFEGLIQLAQSRNAWAAVPFPMRYSHWAETAKHMIESGEAGSISHGIYRMLRPGIQHYYEQDSAWMVSKKEAGGGVLLNLGVHGIDLIRFITGEQPHVVGAATSHSIFNLDVEDYAFITMRTPSGVIFHNEYGYTLPTPGLGDGEKRLDTENMILREVEQGGVRIQGPGRDEVSPQPEGYVGGWPRACIEALEAARRGEPPPVTVADCAAAILPIWDAYKMTGEV